MALVECTESGLKFLIDEEQTFRPELDPAIEKLQRVKRCDFITCHMGRQLVFVEVQSSAPSPLGDQDKVWAELSECHDKFLHSLLLLLSHVCGRIVFSTFPEALNRYNLAAMPVRFVLLLPGFDREGCMHFQDKLQQQMAKVQRAFRHVEAYVVNKENALKKGIILAPTPAHS